jgi:hypothetical protein
VRMCKAARRSCLRMYSHIPVGLAPRVVSASFQWNVCSELQGVVTGMTSCEVDHALHFPGCE